MRWIVIEGVRPYDGRYEFDLDGAPFTLREWGWMKRLSGYLPLTFEEGMNGGDAELITVFALIALYRAGRVAATDIPAAFERFSDIAFGASIQLEQDEQTQAEAEDDAGPPEASSNGNATSSGDDSRPSSESPESPPPPTGTPASATSESHPRAWATSPPTS